eukprot:6197351-Pleurochrysis_carterae.AAC.3
MNPPYHYPFLDPPSQGDPHSTRLPDFDFLNLRINLDQTVPTKRKVVLGDEVKNVPLELQRSVARNTTMWADHPLSDRRLGVSAQDFRLRTF